MIRYQNATCFCRLWFLNCIRQKEKKDNSSLEFCGSLRKFLIDFFASCRKNLKALFHKGIHRQFCSDVSPHTSHHRRTNWCTDVTMKSYSQLVITWLHPRHAFHWLILWHMCKARISLADLVTHISKARISLADLVTHVQGTHFIGWSGDTCTRPINKFKKLLKTFFKIAYQ